MYMMMSLRRRDPGTAKVSFRWANLVFAWSIGGGVEIQIDIVGYYFICMASWVHSGLGALMFSL